MSDMIIFLTTVDSGEKAFQLANELVKRKLAGCVSIAKVSSTYMWKGAIEKSEEFLLIIKTLKNRENKLVAWLKENHPYEAPELVAIETKAFNPYLSWLKESLSE